MVGIKGPRKRKGKGQNNNNLAKIYIYIYIYIYRHAVHARVIVWGCPPTDFDLKQEANSLFRLLLVKDFSLDRSNPLHDFPVFISPNKLFSSDLFATARYYHHHHHHHHHHRHQHHHFQDFFFLFLDSPHHFSRMVRP